MQALPEIIGGFALGFTCGFLFASVLIYTGLKKREAKKYFHAQDFNYHVRPISRGEVNILFPEDVEQERNKP